MNICACATNLALWDFVLCHSCGLHTIDRNSFRASRTYIFTSKSNPISDSMLNPLVSVPRSVTLSALIMSCIIMNSHDRLCLIKKNNRRSSNATRKQRVILRERRSRPRSFPRQWREHKYVFPASPTLVSKLITLLYEHSSRFLDSHDKIQTKCLSMHQNRKREAIK